MEGGGKKEEEIPLCSCVRVAETRATLFPPPPPPLSFTPSLSRQFRFSSLSSPLFFPCRAEDGGQKNEPAAKQPPTPFSLSLVGLVAFERGKPCSPKRDKRQKPPPPFWAMRRQIRQRCAERLERSGNSSTRASSPSRRRKRNTKSEVKALSLPPAAAACVKSNADKNPPGCAKEKGSGKDAKVANKPECLPSSWPPYPAGRWMEVGGGIYPGRYPPPLFGPPSPWGRTYGEEKWGGVVVALARNSATVPRGCRM